ncbi:hypothetical protein [Cryobacterium zhongshanensis]|uniref:Uncharacterized protein n=1 Tax=Cryobacterium zhongshanensis TaxID=2928153 RepID=A0AA41UGI0_9MICO|nr:hypothetical protein [Cryobacterium zhongshanensis]MCI4659768.1 hypothetical protein [Cryobacterium zhongshanensis]
MRALLRRYFASKDWRETWIMGVFTGVTLSLIKAGASFFLQIELPATASWIITAVIVVGGRCVVDLVQRNPPPEPTGDPDDVDP